MDYHDAIEAQFAKMTDEERIEALRAAIQVGVDSSEAHGSLKFESFEALEEHFHRIVEEAIARAAS